MVNCKDKWLLLVRHLKPNNGQVCGHQEHEGRNYALKRCILHFWNLFYILMGPQFLGTFPSEKSPDSARL